MRVAILSDRVPPYHAGGAEIAAWQLALRLAGGGHEVHLIAATGERPRDERRDGVTVHLLRVRYPERFVPWLSVWNPLVAIPLGRLLERLRPDVAHFHNIHRDLTWGSLAIASRLGLPAVFTAHDLMSITCGKVDARLVLPGEPGSGARRLPASYDRHRMRLGHNPWRNRAIRRLLLRDAPVRLSVSEAQRLVLEANGLPGFEVLRNGVDAGRFEADPAAVEEARLELGLAGRRVVLFAGRVGLEKGGGPLAAAIQRAAGRVPEICLLVLARSGERVASFTSGVLDPARVRFAYGVADLVAVPSLAFESGSLVALEAAAAGRAVVATPFGGPGEYVADGLTGLLVDPRDTDALAGAVERLLLDDGLRARLGEAGRRRVRDSFSLERVAAGALDAYRRAIALRRGATDR